MDGSDERLAKWGTGSMSGIRDHVIRRNGHFYRPDARGYCADVEAAGRWTKEDACAYQLNVEGVTVHHISEYPPTVNDGWGFAKDLSDALLKVRPLGGSELFVKRNGQYYADPVYCGRLIEELRTSLDQEIRARIRSERAALSHTGTRNET